MAVISIIVGAASRSWNRWVLMAGGLVVLLLTGSRGGFFALALGLFILALFWRPPRKKQIPFSVRIAGTVLVLLVASMFLYQQGGLGLTGRVELWAGFFDLWRASPWIGIGQTGISTSPAVVTWMEPSWMDAHSMYVQEITRYGIVGGIFAFGGLLVGLGATIVAAIRRWSLPLALMAAYLGAGITEVLHDGWQLLSTHVVMLIVVVLGAVAWNGDHVTRQHGDSS